MKSKNFGNAVNCNEEVLVVLFRPFSALQHGRVLGWVAVTIVVCLYTFLTCSDYFPRLQRVVRKVRAMIKKDEQVKTEAGTGLSNSGQSKIQGKKKHRHHHRNHTRNDSDAEAGNSVSLSHLTPLSDVVIFVLNAYENRKLASILVYREIWSSKLS